MDTSQFIDQLGAGNASEAKNILNDILSTRAFESLDAKKIELARNMFNGSEIQEESELNELSKDTLDSYKKKARKEYEKHITKAQPTIDGRESEESNAHYDRAQKRDAGLNRLFRKTQKEEVDLDEEV
jgi:hypothetical protein